MIIKIVLAGAAITVGLIMLPGIKSVLDELFNVMNTTFALTSFEYMIWLVMPLLLLIGIFVAAVSHFRSSGEDNED